MVWGRDGGGCGRGGKMEGKKSVRWRMRNKVGGEMKKDGGGMRRNLSKKKKNE